MVKLRTADDENRWLSHINPVRAKIVRPVTVQRLEHYSCSARNTQYSTAGEWP